MADIASLGIAINSQSVLGASDALDKMATSASRAGSEVSSVQASTDMLVAALNRNSQATNQLTANIAKIEGASAKLAQQLTNVGTAANDSNTNVVKFSSSSAKIRGDLDTTSESAKKAEAAWRSLGATGASTSQIMAEASAKARTAAAAPPPPPPPPTPPVPPKPPAPAVDALFSKLGPAGQAVNKNLTPQGQAEFKLANMSGNGSVPTRPGVSGMPANSNTRMPRPDELRNLMYQGSDILSSVATASPGMILMQQGPQIAQMFGPGGLSITGLFKAAGEGATNLATKIGYTGAAIGALTAVVAAGATAWYSYNSAQQDLEKNLNGIGRASGASAGQVNKIATDLSNTTKLSTRQAREMAGEYAATGKISSSMFAGIASVASDYAKITGQDLTDANKELASSFADPTKGAEALNEKLGFLSATTLDSIQSMQMQGNRLGAQKVLIDALKNGVAEAATETSGWSRLTSTLGKGVSEAWEAAGAAVDRAITGGDLETRIENLQRLIKETPTEENSLMAKIFGTDPAVLQIRTKQLAELIALRDKAASGRENVQANQNSLQLRGTLQALNPQAEQMKQLEAQATQLRTALAQPAKWNLDGATLALAESSFERISRQIKTMTADIRDFGSAATAELSRATDFQLKTATMTGAGQSYNRAQFDYDKALRDRNLDPNTKSVAEVNAEYDKKAESTDARDLNQLQAARAEALKAATEVEALKAIKANQEKIVVTQEMAAGAKSSGLLAQAPAQYREDMVKAAAKEGVPLDLYLAIIKRESNFNPNADANKNFPNSHAYGFGQLQPDTARGEGVNERDPVQNIYGTASYMRKAYERAGGDPFKTYQYYHDGIYSQKGPSDAARSAGADVLRYMGTPTTSTSIREADDRTKGLQAQQQAVKTQQQLMDVSGLKLDEVTRYQQLYNDELKRTGQVTPELDAQFKELAKGMAQSARDLSNTKAFKDLSFDREQIGRTQGDQSAYSRARSIYGDTTSFESQSYIETSRMNDNLKQTKDLASGVFSGMLNDLRSGTSLSNTLFNALGRIADKLITSGSDRLISMLFGSMDKSSGSSLSFISSLFGSGGVPGKADGGPIHGSGGPRSDNLLIAVSNGEYIVNAAAAGKNRGLLDAINYGGAFADGGPVGGRSSTVSYQSMSVNTSSAPPINFITPPGTSIEADGPPQRRADGGYDQMIKIAERGMGNRAKRGQGPFKETNSGAWARQG